jgi:ribosome-associated protein
MCGFKYCLYREEVSGITSQQKALQIAGAASDKKAHGIVIMDMRKFATVCDYFVISSGTSSTQVDAIADHIAHEMAHHKEKLRHREADNKSLWVLMDYGDVVAHIFQEETRAFYDLEGLWSDAPTRRFKEPGKKKAPKKRKSVTHDKRKHAKSRKAA